MYQRVNFDEIVLNASASFDEALNEYNKWVSKPFFEREWSQLRMNMWVCVCTL